MIPQNDISVTNLSPRFPFRNKKRNSQATLYGATAAVRSRDLRLFCC